MTLAELPIAIDTEEIASFCRERGIRRLAVFGSALRGDFSPGPDTLNLARPLLVAPNVLLTFAAPVLVSGLYGSCRAARQLALYVDQPALLLAAPDGSTRS